MNRNKELKRVVITGMGAITPLGNSAGEFWKNMVAGKSGVDFITKFDSTHFKTKLAAEVKGFKSSLHLKKTKLVHSICLHICGGSCCRSDKTCRIKF